MMRMVSSWCRWWLETWTVVGLALLVVWTLTATSQACPPVAVNAAGSCATAQTLVPTISVAPLAVSTFAVQPVLVPAPVVVQQQVVRQQVVRQRVVQPRQIIRSRTVTCVGGFGLF